MSIKKCLDVEWEQDIFKLVIPFVSRIGKVIEPRNETHQEENPDIKPNGYG